MPFLQLTMPAPKAVQSVRPFSFHGVLAEDGSQADVLQACGITTLLDAALAGFHVTIFAYGQTGSGKTFTMAGREEVLALEDYSGDESFKQMSAHDLPKSAVLYLKHA